MWYQFLALALPRFCILCHAFTYNERNLCQACANYLPWLGSACHRCGLPLPADLKISCGECLQNPPEFHQTLAVFEYTQPIIYLITMLKFHGHLSIGALLGEYLKQKILDYYTDKAWPQCIIPMPLHSKRLRQRGFNQALEIAKPIQRYTQLPLNLNACERSKETYMQLSLAAKLREKNVKQAFTIRSFPGNHVAIVDDVMTTGHTMRALSLALTKAGVKQIDVWCCARTGK